MFKPFLSVPLGPAPPNGFLNNSTLKARFWRQDILNSRRK